LRNPLKLATDGDDALQYLSGEGKYANRGEYPLPGLLLLDLKLPKISGLDLLLWIRQHPPIRLMPVIVLSSSNKPADVCCAYERGANAYLVKPAKPDDLIRLIASFKDFWLNRVEAPPDCSKFTDRYSDS
jgi:CheY-like chemotaxis protein